MQPGCGVDPTGRSAVCRSRLPWKGLSRTGSGKRNWNGDVSVWKTLERDVAGTGKGSQVRWCADRGGEGDCLSDDARICAAGQCYGRRSDVGKQHKRIGQTAVRKQQIRLTVAVEIGYSHGCEARTGNEVRFSAEFASGQAVNDGDCRSAVVDYCRRCPPLCSEQSRRGRLHSDRRRSMFGILDRAQRLSRLRKCAVTFSVIDEIELGRGRTFSGARVSRRTAKSAFPSWSKSPAITAPQHRTVVDRRMRAPTASAVLYQRFRLHGPTGPASLLVQQRQGPSCRRR